MPDELASATNAICPTPKCIFLMMPAIGSWKPPSEAFPLYAIFSHRRCLDPGELGERRVTARKPPWHQSDHRVHLDAAADRDRGETLASARP